MKKQILTSLGVLALLPAANAAVVITNATGAPASGYAITGAEVADFRSTSVTKTYDVSGDNAYGTSGYMVFGGAAADVNGQPLVGTSTVSSNPSFVTTIAAGAQFLSVSRNTGYPTYDNPANGISATVADFGATAIALANANTGAGAWNEMLTFTINSTAPASFRLGIMAGNEATTDGRWDPTALRLSFAGGSATTVSGLGILGAETGMVFFDVAVTGGSTGTFSIESQRRATAGGSSIAGITFDVVPEPSSAALLGLGMAGFLFRRKRC